MISRRSEPRRTPAHREAMMTESAAGIREAGGVNDVPAADDDVFFCVAATSRGSKNRISFFHTNARGEDAAAARALAALCLDHAPEHHRWHHHTVAGARTFAFLSSAGADGRTYFAAAEPTPGGAETVRFLERVRDACDAAPRRRLRGEAVGPVARHFARALRAVAADVGGGGGAPSAVDDVALLPGASKDEDEHVPMGAQQFRAVQAEESEQASSSWWRTWRRHAVVAIAVDVVVCLVLFAVWMGVCKGFRCLTR
ncbi:hypothetical protein QOZ80_1AG0041820 [Eleusine coracana subsp. coracana]|nr:hypothetical protein QOZ80_1AG0041820 [Eleusine coracana subsp. coracana]